MNQCYFCKIETDPDYKEAKSLKKFLTEKGKIVSRERNSLCHKHQADLAKAVKRARELALLPFVTVLK